MSKSLRKSKSLSYLESFSIPQDYTSIGKNVFEDCLTLKEIIIPASITKVSEGAFYGCNNLGNIIVDEENEYLSTSEDNKVLFSDKGKTLLFYSPTKTDKHYTIPSSVTKIGYGAFAMAKFENIVIPDSVKFIGDKAFEFCDRLTKRVFIPNSVVSIGKDAFAMCSMTDLIIGDSVKSIDDCAFMGCYSLKEMVIGASLQELGDQVFSGCVNLKNIIVDSRNKTFESIGVKLSKKDGSMVLVPSISGLEVMDNIERERALSKNI